jgi:hypothetical protein
LKIFVSEEGSAIVVMDKVDYLEEANRQLGVVDFMNFR